MGERDWIEWHRRYDDPTSRQSRRLAIVRHRVAEALDAAPPGPVRVASLCAGDGRDLLGVLEAHPRAAAVTGLLVEQDPDLAARARARAAAVPGAVEVVTGDAASTDVYAGIVPVDVLLVCGVFGNVPDADIARTVAALPAFGRPGTRVVWTRHRRPPDLVPTVVRWFAGAGYDGWFVDGPAAGGFCVGGSVQRAPARPLPAGVRLFAFR